MQPGRHDYLDTGLGISIWASHKLHRVASGWWWMVMNRKDSTLGSPSYHHQRFPGDCQLEFERCRKFLTFFLEAEEYGIEILKVQEIILGIGKAAGTVKLLLDIDKVLSTNEVLDLRATAMEDGQMAAASPTSAS
jgi:hypothetical protein